jgi:hypothetical protein
MSAVHPPTNQGLNPYVFEHTHHGQVVSPPYPYLPHQMPHGSVSHMYPPHHLQQVPVASYPYGPSYPYVPAPAIHNPMSQPYVLQPNTAHYPQAAQVVPQPHTPPGLNAVQGVHQPSSLHTSDSPEEYSQGGVSHAGETSASSNPSSINWSFESVAKDSDATCLKYYLDKGYTNCHKVLKISHKHARADLICNLLLETTDDWAREMIHLSMEEHCTTSSTALEIGQPLRLRFSNFTYSYHFQPLLRRCYNVSSDSSAGLKKVTRGR